MPPECIFLRANARKKCYTPAILPIFGHFFFIMHYFAVFYNFLEK